MSRCLYPGCSTEHQPEFPFCMKHWNQCGVVSQKMLLADIKESGSLDYRRVTNSANRALQRNSTITIVDEMIKVAAGVAARAGDHVHVHLRTNPYKSIR